MNKRKQYFSEKVAALRDFYQSHGGASESAPVVKASVPKVKTASPQQSKPKPAQPKPQPQSQPSSSSGIGLYFINLFRTV